MGKGEIARYEQFLLFPNCFLKICAAARKSKGLFGIGLKDIDIVNYSAYISMDPSTKTYQISIHLLSIRKSTSPGRLVSVPNIEYFNKS